MNIENFKIKMIGEWVSQSTNYGLLNHSHLANSTFINQVRWTYIENNNAYLNFIKKKIHKINTNNEISLYKVQSADNKSNYLIYYIVLLENSCNQAILLKFNETFQLSNKFIVQESSTNYLCLISRIQNIKVIEQIYFLNTNVKLIKSIVKKYNKYIATSFSSEIRIS